MVIRRLTKGDRGAETAALTTAKGGKPAARNRPAVRDF
jgi:hypothetical protein